MKTIYLLLFSISFSIILSCSDKNADTKNQKSNISAKEFVETIDSLGYFKYADAKNLDTLKKNHLESFNPKGSWGGLWDDDTFIPLDYRYYICDGEFVYEEGGFTEMLEDMKPSFDKFGFKLSIDKHYEEWDFKNNWLNHRITLNNTEYVIFKDFKGYGWGEAVQRLAEIVNSELEKQKIEEKIYLINGGHGGSLIFLDQQLYKYFYYVFSDPDFKPLEVNEWVKVMRIKPMKIK